MTAPRATLANAGVTPVQLQDRLRAAAERSLFFYMQSILGLSFLSKDLHLQMCRFVQNPQSTRKLILVPRDHVKTTTVKALISHMLIQPKAANIYFPGLSGTDLRMIIAGETTRNAARHLRNVESVITSNQVFKTLWPHIKPGPKWSEHEMQVERNAAYSEPTCEALGTDSAIASRHVDVIFCDDIFTFEASQSSSVAERVRLWFAALEPILDETENTIAKLFVTGTPWSQNDIYYSILNEPALREQFDVYHRSAIEDGAPIWPERFPLDRLARIEASLRGTGLWELNWMCNYENTETTDLRSHWLQTFRLEGDLICTN